MRTGAMDENRSTATPVRSEFRAVLACCATASLAAVGWSWRNGALLNYGDAVAHLHIARRVGDCRFHSIGELGSVWLPLPHLLMLPFVQVYAWWANGIAGTIPSVLAWLVSCVGLYRLARRWLRPQAAGLALAFFALNPNLLYLQTTAMTEPLFLCEMIWAIALLADWRASLDTDPERAVGLQVWIAAVLIAAVWTRYDGWVIALLAWLGIGIALWRRGKLRSTSFWLCSAALAAAPAAWLIYNAIQFGDWLEFARGPYSAKAIELRTAANGPGPPHPGWHNPWVSLKFFLKVAEMDAAAAAWGNVTLAVAVLGAVGAWIAVRRRAFAWTLLLWLPVPFYAYSVAYGSVPIFIPPWWPHSWYNTRYGLELLPALALGLGFVAQFFVSAVREFKPQWTKFAVGAIAALLVANAWTMVCERPLVYVEGTKNIDARRPFDENIPPLLRKLLAERPGGAVLMNTSVHPELVAFTGIPLRQTINESDQYIYRDALAAPASNAAIVLAFDGDEIAHAVKAHPEELTAVGRFTAKGQPPGTIYISDTWPNQ
jgi:hypothetical protein